MNAKSEYFIPNSKGLSLWQVKIVEVQHNSKHSAALKREKRMDIQFTHKEQVFVDRIMKPYQEHISKNPILYWAFLDKVLDGLGALKFNTSAGNEMIEGLKYKIAMAKAAEEMDKLLTDPTYGETYVPNTKGASWGRVTNLTEKHEVILGVLAKTPDMSRRDLAQSLGWPINRVTPRVLELIEMGKVKIDGTKWDITTERQVQTLEVV